MVSRYFNFLLAFKLILKSSSLKYSQKGFLFSNKEPTALLQLHGGPCAILAPVQAYLLKDLLFTNPKNDWRSLKGKLR